MKVSTKLIADGYTMTAETKNASMAIWTIHKRGVEVATRGIPYKLHINTIYMGGPRDEIIKIINPMLIEAGIGKEYNL